MTYFAKKQRQTTRARQFVQFVHLVKNLSSLTNSFCERLRIFLFSNCLFVACFQQAFFTFFLVLKNKSHKIEIFLFSSLCGIRYQTWFRGNCSQIVKNEKVKQNQRLTWVKRHISSRKIEKQKASKKVFPFISSLTSLHRSLTLISCVLFAEPWL